MERARTGSGRAPAHRGSVADSPSDGPRGPGAGYGAGPTPRGSSPASGRARRSWGATISPREVDAPPSGLRCATISLVRSTLLHLAFATPPSASRGRDAPPSGREVASLSSAPRHAPRHAPGAHTSARISDTSLWPSRTSIRSASSTSTLSTFQGRGRGTWHPSRSDIPWR